MLYLCVYVFAHALQVSLFGLQLALHFVPVPQRLVFSYFQVAVLVYKMLLFLVELHYFRAQHADLTLFSSIQDCRPPAASKPFVWLGPTELLHIGRSQRGARCRRRAF